jgi:hypothetical protein
MDEYPHLDRNGYAPSIIPGHDENTCWLCGKNGNGKLDRHEIVRHSFGGADRKLCKFYGLWVHLCHYPCHEGSRGVHADSEIDLRLKQEAQRCAMEHYGWTTEDFVYVFGRNYL